MAWLGAGRRCERVRGRCSGWVRGGLGRRGGKAGEGEGEEGREERSGRREERKGGGIRREKWELRGEKKVSVAILLFLSFFHSFTDFPTSAAVTATHSPAPVIPTHHSPPFPGVDAPTPPLTQLLFWLLLGLFLWAAVAVAVVAVGGGLWIRLESASASARMLASRAPPVGGGGVGSGVG